MGGTKEALDSYDEEKRTEIIHIEKIRYGDALIVLVFLIPLIIYFFHNSKFYFTIFLCIFCYLVLANKTKYSIYYRDKMIFKSPLSLRTNVVYYKYVKNITVIDGHSTEPKLLKVEYIYKRKKTTVRTPAPSKDVVEKISEYVFDK